MKTYESFRKGKESKPKDPYSITVEYEHGDADFKTKEKFSFKTEEEMRKVLKVLIKVRNFIPKKGYGNLGYYEPVTENDGGLKLSDILDEETIDLYSGWYIQPDKHYNQGYASIEGISVKINGEKYILLDSEAAETDIIDLPKPGDEISINVNHISGYGPSVFGEDKEYLPNSGEKDYLKKTFKAKVIDCKIAEDDYMKDGIEYFPYVILWKTDEKVLKNGKDIFLGTDQICGWDKDFGKKYNKDEFDDLRIYVL